MRLILTGLFAAILSLMLAVTVWASFERSVFEAGDLFADRRFVATFCDAYCGFLTFYVWVAYRERHPVAKVAWFIAIMGLGNIAMSGYMLWQLWRLRPSGAWRELLLNQKVEAHR